MGASPDELKEWTADTITRAAEKLGDKITEAGATKSDEFLAGIESKLDKMTKEGKTPGGGYEILALLGLYAIAEGRKWLRDKFHIKEANGEKESG